MKVLTLTLQNAKNMGAQLQCFALSKYLNNQKNITCEVLRYYPNNYNISWEYYHKPQGFKGYILLLYRLLRIDNYMAFKKKNMVMRSFQDKNIPLTKRHYFRKDIIESPPIADAIICGSDQIWNFKLRKDLTYLLDFVKDERTKRIAYAASMAEPWTTEECCETKSLLNKFHAIGIREEGDLELVNSLLDKSKAHVVVDPVFLLPRKEWDAMARKPKIEEPYIFCYFLGTDDYTIKAVKRVQELTGYKIVHLNINNRDRFNSDWNIVVADPCDFVGLIANAAVVCTNSFHCTAFSIIYRRNVLNIPRILGNARIRSLEQVFDIPNIILYQERLANLTVAGLKTDYSKCDKAYNDAVEFSKDFLINALHD